MPNTRSLFLPRPLRLILLFMQVSVQNFAAYRFDFFVRLAVSLLHLVGELFTVWIIFANAREIRGWSWQHMLVLVGVFRIIAGGIRMSIVPNMHRVLEEIRDGTLDFVLLKPVHPQFLVSIREFVFWRISDVVLGLTVSLYGCRLLLGRLPLAGVLNFALMLAAASVIVYALWLMLATLCFWFVRIQNIEMIFWNVFEAGRFPIVIYPDWLRWTLTFLIPLAFITTIPASALLGSADEVLTHATWWACALAAGMFYIASRFWRFGLKHYSGASA